MSVRTDQQRRASRSIVVVAALVLGSVLTLATAGATGSGSTSWPEAVKFTKAWTNDDGRVNGPDVGDIGDTSLVFDLWGSRSSDDPPTAGFGIDRLDKDVARCKAWIPKRAPYKTKVKIQNAYPGYVCTVRTKLTNLTLFPIDVGSPVVTADRGLTVGEVGTTPLPKTIYPGQSVKTAFSIRVEQSADQDDRDRFEIAINLAKADVHTCKPLKLRDVPDGSKLIAKKHRCIDFFVKERDAKCGPGWTEDAPYAWHFVAAWISPTHRAELTAVFQDQGVIGPVEATYKGKLIQHFWVYTESPDTLRGAYIDRAAKGLYLVNTCSAPDDPSD